jgi:hypothetical protein
MTTGQWQADRKWRGVLWATVRATNGRVWRRVRHEAGRFTVYSWKSAWNRGKIARGTGTLDQAAHVAALPIERLRNKALWYQRVKGAK